MLGQMIKAAIIIPSLEPTERLIQTIDSLHICLNEAANSNIHADILVVDDGSGADYFHIFEQIEKQYKCKLLRHAVNLGKGRALKTAFNYYLNEYTDYHGVVTADSDGQHAAEDIIKCINALSDSNSLVLGCRDFNRKNIPTRSLLGNKITRNLFNFFCGTKISDTQTGLRAIPSGLVKSMITIPGERFEYEMNMIVECGNKKIAIKEVPIKTIYPDNVSSHFNTVFDAIRVYKTFIKYILSAFSSFLLDIALFAIIVAITKDIFPAYILISTIAARVISSLYNYLINRNIVFSGNKGRHTFVKYYCLATGIMISSGFLTTFLFGLSGFHEVSIKMPVDIALFLCSYYFQKKWIF